MMRAWTLWRISTAIDKGKPLSPALARKVRSDPECRRFYEASLAMSSRLRLDAGDVLRDEQRRLEQRLGEIGPVDPLEKADVGPTPSRRLRPATVACLVAATAAVAVVAVSWFVIRQPLASRDDGDTSPTSAPNIPKPSDDCEVTQAEVEELARDLDLLARNLRRNAEKEIPALREAILDSDLSLRGPLNRETENLAADTRRIVQSFASLLPLRDRENPPEPELDVPPTPDRPAQPSSTDDDHQTRFPPAEHRCRPSLLACN